MEITTCIHIDDQCLADLVVTAFEGGSTHWCRGAYMKRGKPVLRPWYSDPVFWGDPGGYEIEVHFDDPNVEGKGQKIIGPADITAGMKIFVNKYPTAFSDFLREEYDADTADIFWQCVVLGDLVYG